MLNSQINELFDRAFQKPVFIVVILALVIVTRFPLLPLSEDAYAISSDVDAPNYLTTALKLIYEGEYRPSRPPGYLLMELINYLSVRVFGVNALGTCLINIFSFCLASYIFARILIYYRVSYRFLVWLAFTFMPLWIVENCSTTEYTLSITSLLIGWYMLAYNRYILAGFLLGLAIALRPSQTPVIYLVFALFTIFYNKKMIYFFNLLFASLFTVFFFWFLPMWCLSGNLSFLTVAPWKGTITEKILGAGYDLQRAFGMQGLIAIGFSLLLNSIMLFRGYWRLWITGSAVPSSPLKSLDSTTSEKTLSKHLLFVATFGTVANLAIILYAPHKVAYALQMTPFMLIVLSKLRGLVSFPAIAVALLSYLVIGLPSVDIYNGQPRFRWIAPGMISIERESRSQSLLIISRLLHNTPEKSVVFLSYIHGMDLIIYNNYLEKRIRYENQYCTIHLVEKDIWFVKIPPQAWLGDSQDAARESAFCIQLVENLIRSGRQLYYIPQNRHLYSRARVAHWLDKATMWDPIISAFPPYPSKY
jgi:hypothetical protein